MLEIFHKMMQQDLCSGNMNFPASHVLQGFRPETPVVVSGWSLWKLLAASDFMRVCMELHAL